MFGSLVRSYKKSKRLKEISSVLGQSLNLSALSGDALYDLVSKGNPKDKFIEELLDLAISDPNVQSILDRHQANRTTLKDLYQKLLLSGAGQFAGGHYVAASSIAYPQTVKFLLEHFDGQEFSAAGHDPYNSTLLIAYSLIMYFEKGSFGEVTFS